MSNASSTVEIVALNVEIDRLRQKEYFLEKKMEVQEEQIKVANHRISDLEGKEN